MKRIVWVASSIAKPDLVVSLNSMSPFLRAAREMAFEIIETSLPQYAERLRPFDNGLDGLGAEASRASLRVPSLLDQSSALENRQMLGDCRLGQAKRRRQFANTCLT